MAFLPTQAAPEPDLFSAWTPSSSYSGLTPYSELPSPLTNLDRDVYRSLTYLLAFFDLPNGFRTEVFRNRKEGKGRERGGKIERVTYNKKIATILFHLLIFRCFFIPH